MSPNNLNINYFSRSDYINLKPISTANLSSFFNSSSSTFLNGSSSVEQTIAFLNNFGKFWWRKTPVDFSIKTVDSSVSTYASPYTVYYGDKLILNSFLNLDVESAQKYSGTLTQVRNFCQNNLKGKFVSVDNRLDWCKASDFSISGSEDDVLVCKGQVYSIKTVSLSPSSYIYSENENEYPDGLVENRYLYEKTKNLYSNFQTAVQSEKVVYTRTGVVNNYINISFSFSPSLVIISSVLNSPQQFTICTPYRAFYSYFQGNQSVYAIRCQITKNQLLLYSGRNNILFNSNGYPYIAIAIG